MNSGSFCPFICFLFCFPKDSGLWSGAFKVLGPVFSLLRFVGPPVSSFSPSASGWFFLPLCGFVGFSCMWSRENYKVSISSQRVLVFEPWL